MHCKNCGAQVPDGAAFCANCGTPVATAESTDEQPWTCPHCGATVKAANRFCTSCGNPRPEPAASVAGPAADEAPVAASGPISAPADAPADAVHPTAGNQPAGEPPIDPFAYVPPIEGADSPDTTSDFATGADPFAASSAFSVPAPTPEPVGASDSETRAWTAPMPVPSAPTPANRTNPKARRAVVIAAIAAVAVIAVIAIALVTKPWHARGAQATYGAADAVKTSRITKIIPASSSDQPLTHYYARVIDAADTKEAVDVLSLPKLEVRDDQGFTMGDFKSDLPAGSYTVQVTDDDGTAQNTPQLDYDPSDDADAGDSVTIVPPAGDDQASQQNASKKGRYGAYQQVLEDLQKQYGETSIVQVSRFAHISGVSFAQLVDFGDGIPRLVVVYYRGDSYTDATAMAYGNINPKAYAVEVYEYDESSDAAKQVVQEQLAYNSASDFFLTLGSSQDDKKTYLAASDGWTYDKFYGIKDDGTFGLVSDIEYVTEAGGELTINGQAFDPDSNYGPLVSEEQAKYTQNPQIWWIVANVGSSSSDDAVGSGSNWGYIYPDSTTDHSLGESARTVATLLAQLKGEGVAETATGANGGSAAPAASVSGQTDVGSA